MAGNGLLFILVGPSGAGKNTLMRATKQHFANLRQLATATTRTMRPGEQQNREHLFVSLAEFRRMVANDELVEHQNVHLDDWYGTPRHSLESAFADDRDLIADIECLGAEQVYAEYADNTVLIFVSPSSVEVLAERIRLRGNVSDEELAGRLARARFEMTFARHCHYLIINDVVEPAAEHLRQIIASERARRRAEALPADQLLPRPRVHSAVSALIARGEHLLVRADSGDVRLPTFTLPAPGIQSPADHLVSRLSEALGLAVTVHHIVDARFQECAPHHVALATIPYDVYLYYTYRCSVTGDATPSTPEWNWRPIADLRLSDAVAEALAAPTG